MQTLREPVQDRQDSPQSQLSAVADRVMAEYHEMPGLKLTVAQASRLWAIDARFCEGLLQHLAELSPRTFCTFAREFSSFRRGKRRQRESDADPGTRFCPSSRATARSTSPGQLPSDARVRCRRAVSSRWSCGRLD